MASPVLEPAPIAARRWILSGHIQGVGFRPFVYRLARQYRLSGWVRNRVGLVEIEARGAPQNLSNFARDLVVRAPTLARPRVDSCDPAPVVDTEGFSILESVSDGDIDVQVPPDLFLCDDCLREMNDPANRRYRYPFINCTQCGPRYTLIRAMPYDRPNTTMSVFDLCTRCRVEYDDPADRRFHAEPIACPDCGPSLEYRPIDGEVVSGNEEAVAACLKTLREQGIVAVKGVGGYHLVCDARDQTAVARLRAKKPRPDKPLAVMFPSPPDDPLSGARRSVTLSREQADLLCSPARPIVLARKRSPDDLAKSISPGLDELGAMLPYSPLHHLLLDDFGGPLVTTSANISGEPVLTGTREVQARLAHLVDGFLLHDRTIERPADDSVFRFIQAGPRPIRYGRGHAPLELALPFTLARPVLALGGQMKNTVALGWSNRVVVSPHIGDLQSLRSLEVLDRTIKDLQNLYQIEAELVIRDAHPGYATTRYADETGLPVREIWHHRAHASAACGFEPDPETWLVFTWDGVGYGEDGTLWGGEALLGRPGAWRRFASMRPFRIPGGDRAGREPWRSAAALCWELGLECPVAPEGASLLYSAWRQRINSPSTSAVGRLFDAAAALAGVCGRASFEGQGPMLLESLCAGPGDAIDLPLARDSVGLWVSDWAPLLQRLLDSDHTPRARASTMHATMARVIVEQALRAREDEGVCRIGLSGGVFQNRLLTESAISLLEREGFEITLPTQVPANDAGLSLGQIFEFGFGSA